MTKKLVQNEKKTDEATISADEHNEIKLTTAEENSTAALTLASQAKHSIDIFTQDMDAAIYDNSEFERYIFELSKKHPTTLIRILTQDSSTAIRNGHCLIRLAQKLTSSVFIHNPSREHKNETSAFMLMDKRGYLHRVTADKRNFKASFSTNSPQRAGKLADTFDEIWEHSTPDVQIRRIFV